MAEEVICLDTSVWIKVLTDEEPRAQSEAAERLVLRGLIAGRLVAPGWAWAEVGTVLRKKVRQGLLEPAEAEVSWDRFCRLPIEFVEHPALRARAWDLAEHYGLLTLYDAAFLACTEVTLAEEPAVREFWTADQQLLTHLGAQCPAYVQQI